MSESPCAVLQRSHDAGWVVFENPLEVLSAYQIDDVVRVLDQAQDAASRGLIAVGFLSYEAAPAFDPAMTVRAPGPFPLAWFALFETHRPFETCGREPTPELPQLEWTPSVGVESYRRSIDRIHDWIAAGDTYQVNYTHRLRAPFRGSAGDYFRSLAARGDSRHGAFIDLGRHALCSLSPELFFRLEDNRLVTRPMKGTTRRGRTTREDAVRSRELRASVKDRAENVMIVDMMRNDLGRVARPGTVKVSRLWEVERYPTLFQLTSTCSASTDASVDEILAALFPSASITGAPKIRTMERIADIEDSPRGVYTGAIGRIGPGRSACFSVAIRTVHVDRQLKQAEYGTGGGIVWDSVADEEYEETRAKALVVTSPPPPFALLETLRWGPEKGFVLLDRHLERLLDSATYFDRRVARLEILERLEEAVDGKRSAQRVRLELARDGSIGIQVVELPHGKRRWSVDLARQPVDSADPFLFHKTTHRRIYEEARASRPELDDILLWNERGEITESTIANVVVRRDNELVTPPVECGLLPGTARAELLERGRIQEGIVRSDELVDVEALYLVNSVRGWIRAVLSTADLTAATRASKPT